MIKKLLYLFLLFSITSFAQVANQPSDLTVCDDNNDGFAQFDLTVLNTQILGGQNPVNFTLTYHETLSDADNGNNAISSPYFNITQSIQTIYIRLEENSTGNYDTSNTNLIVNPTEIEVEIISNDVFFYDTDSDPSTPEGANLCGFESVTIEADSAFADTFAWYRNGFLLPSETSSTLVITESGNYQVQVFYIQCGVSAISQLVNLNLYEDVGSIDSQIIVTCADSGTDAVDFDLDALSTSLGLGEGFTISYYINLADANQAINAVASPYSSTGETLLMRVEDTDAVNDSFIGCRTISEVELVTDCNNTGVISVSVFLDDNENSIFDTTESNFTNGYFTYEINNDGILNTIESSIGSFAIASSDEANTYDINYYVYNQYEDCYNATTTSFEDVNVAFGENISAEFPVIIDQSCEDISVHLINQNPPRPGFNHINYLVIENLGVVSASGTVDYTLDENLAILNVSGGDNFTRTLNATGFSLDFVNLEPGQIINVFISLQTPTSVELGEMVTNSAIYTTSSNDIFSDNNESSLTEEVIGSYDPNDKMESHGKDIIYDDFINSDEYLYYTIRFQNVGTAEAIFIRIEDELNAMLDEETFQMLRSSHDYMVTRTENSLEWFFDDINLPAEQDDVEGSNGFVYFKIKPKPGYSLGDVIPNSASIYFDFNAPIITNTFTTTFIAPLSVDSFETLSFKMYPNPANDYVTIELKDISQSYKLEIYDIQGKLILENNSVNSEPMQLNISEFNSGFYFIKVSNVKVSETQKLIID